MPFVDPFAQKANEEPSGFVDPFAVKEEPAGFVDPFAAKERPSVEVPASGKERPGIGENVLNFARDVARGFFAAPRDLAAFLAKGAVAGGEAIVGGANLMTAGQAGRGLEMAGYDPKTTKEAINKLHSPEYQASQERVAGADGVVGTVKEAIKNPMTLAGAVVEAAPSMIMAGSLARGAMKVAPGMSPVVAGAIGEGGITAAQQAEQIRQANDGAGALSPSQMALAAGSGAITSAIGLAGGKLLDKIGVVDIDTFIAGGGLSKPGALKSRVGQVVSGMISEGLFQEFPQSAQEQIAVNIATGKPWNEGVGESAAMGGLVGGVMGAGGAYLGANADAINRTTPAAPQAGLPAAGQPNAAQVESKPVEQPAPVAPAPDAVKELWQMTQAERVSAAESSLLEKDKADPEWVSGFLGNQKIYHRNAVKQALIDGKPVPAEVLADYPDLKKQFQGSETTAAEVPIIGTPDQTAKQPAGTGIKHEAVNRQRAERGLPPLITPDAQTNQGQLNEALDVIAQNPNAADEIIAKVQAKPRALSPVESFILLQREADLRFQFNKASADVNAAVDEGRTAEVDDLMAVRDAISDRMSALESAARASGSEAGRSLQVRRRMLMEDYSLASMETRLRAAKRGERLAPEDSAKINQIAADLVDADQQLAESLAKDEQANGKPSVETRRAVRRQAAVKARFDGMVEAVRAVARTETAMAEAGRFLRPAQKTQLSDLNTKWFTAQDAYNKAVADFEKTPTEDGIIEMQRLRRDLLAAERKLAEFTGRLIKMSGGKMASTMVKGNLLVWKSQAINVLSNVQMQFINDVGQTLSASVDLVTSMIRNQPRTVGFPSIVGRSEGAVFGLKRGIRELWTGARPGDNLHGEKGMREFHPLEALKDVFHPSRLPVKANGRVALSDYVKSIVEATFGIAPTVNFRSLGLGDHPFRESTYRSIVREQAALKKLKGREKKYFLAHPDSATIQLALKESLASVYQNNDAAANAIRQLINVPSSTLGYLGDWVEAGIVTPIAPYVTTPINLAHIGLQLASPEYSSARAIWYAERAARASSQAATETDVEKQSQLRADAAYNKRRGYESMSRALIGGAMSIAAGVFVKAGLVSGPPDKNKKKAALQYATLPPNTFNLSGAQRLMRGEDPSWRPGDVYQDLNSMGFAGMMLSVTASGKAAADENGTSFDSYLDSRKTVFPAVGTAMLNMTVMRGGYLAAKAIADQDYGQLNKSFGSVWVSAALPNQLFSVNRARNKYLPDTRGQDDFINALKIAAQERNPLINMNQIYPYRYDPLGKPIQRTPDGAQPWVYHLFDPTKTAKVSADPAWNLIGRLYEKTGDASVIPSMPSRNLAGQKLAPFEYERMMQLVGEERMRRVNDWALNNQNWGRYNDQQRVKVLEKAYREGSEIGRRRFIDEKTKRERQIKQNKAEGVVDYNDLIYIIRKVN